MPAVIPFYGINFSYMNSLRKEWVPELSSLVRTGLDHPFQVQVSEAVIRCIPDGIVVTDAQERIVAVNPAFSRLTGFNLEDVRGKKPARLLQGPASDPVVMGKIRQALDNLETAQFEVVYLTRNGRPIRIDLLVHPLSGLDGNLVGYCFLHRSVREEKSAAGSLQAMKQELQSSNRNLADLNQTLEELSHGLSHALRDPISNILGLVHLLTRSLGPWMTAQEHQYSAMISGCAERLSNTVDGLLDYARTTRISEPACKLRISELVEGVRDDLSALLAESESRLVLVGEDLEICGHAFQLQRLLLNLAACSIRYRSFDPPLIEIETGECEEFWWIQVSDNGIGIQPGEQECIFEVSSQGSGIGLALCKRIAGLHGGSITVQSDPGRGSRFSVSLRKQLLNRS